MKTPAIFVPLSQIQWLIAENQQGEAIQNGGEGA
jgi:hypothetical protein